MSDHEEARRVCPECLAVFREVSRRCPLDGAELQRPGSDHLAGSTLAGRYVLEECVGEGSAGRVYRAHHLVMSRRFAIKIPFGDHLADGDVRERFAGEAEAASRLNHPHVVTVTDFGETEGGIPYLVMDWVEGASLAEVLERKTPLDKATLLLPDAPPRRSRAADETPTAGPPAPAAGAVDPDPASSPAPLPSPAGEDREDERRRRVTLPVWIAGGTAITALGGGVAFGMAARSAERRLARDGCAEVACPGGRVRGLERRMLAADIMYGAAAVAGITAGALYYFSGRRGDRETPVVSVSTGRDSAAVILQGSF